MSIIKFWILLLFWSLASSMYAQTAKLNPMMLPNLYNDDGDEFVIIAHRGASAYYPENTMAAFREAVDMKAEMIELDVLMSKDGVPIVFHDARLNDHTNGKGKVGAFTLKELKKLDAGSWKDPKFAGESIPTLEEVLQFASGTIALNIEIKTEAVTDELRGGVEEKSLALVKKYDMEDHVLFSSFDYRAIKHLKELNPAIPVAILNERRQSRKRLPSELLRDYNADAFNCSARELNKNRLADIREHGIPVFVYTINKRIQMRRLLDLGVTGVFSDKPDVLREEAKKFRDEKGPTGKGS